MFFYSEKYLIFAQTLIKIRRMFARKETYKHPFSEHRNSPNPAFYNCPRTSAIDKSFTIIQKIEFDQISNFSQKFLKHETKDISKGQNQIKESQLRKNTSCFNNSVNIHEFSERESSSLHHQSRENKTVAFNFSIDSDVNSQKKFSFGALTEEKPLTQKISQGNDNSTQSFVLSNFARINSEIKEKETISAHCTENETKRLCEEVFHLRREMMILRTINKELNHFNFTQKMEISSLKLKLEDAQNCISVQDNSSNVSQSKEFSNASLLSKNVSKFKWDKSDYPPCEKEFNSNSSTFYKDQNCGTIKNTLSKKSSLANQENTVKGFDSKPNGEINNCCERDANFHQPRSSFNSDYSRERLSPAKGENLRKFLKNIDSQGKLDRSERTVSIKRYVLKDCERKLISAEKVNVRHLNPTFAEGTKYIEDKLIETKHF